MQLLFSDKYYDSEDYEEGKYVQELLNDLRSTDPTVRGEVTQIGHGADWPVVLIEMFQDVDWNTLIAVTGAGGLFLAGDKINKNLNGWLEIAKKVKSVMEKFKPIRVDEYAAVFIALDIYFAKRPKSPVQLMTTVIELDLITSNKERLSRRPDALYIVTVRGNERLYIYGIKSNGQLEFEHDYSTHGYEFNS